MSSTQILGRAARSLSPLERLPREVIDRILGFLVPERRRTTSRPAHDDKSYTRYTKADVSGLASVCLASRALIWQARAQLYNSVFLQEVKMRQAMNFLRTMAETPRLRRFVRRLGIDNITRTDKLWATRRAIKNKSPTIYKALLAQGDIPVPLLQQLLPLTSENPGDSDRIRAVQGVYQAILLCLPQLRKLTLACPLSIRFLLPQLSFSASPEDLVALTPKTFLPNLTDLTIDRLLVHTNWLSAVKVIGDSLPPQQWDSFASIPLIYHPSIQKVRFLSLDTYPWECNLKVEHKPLNMPVRHLHINQIRQDFQDVWALTSRMPHLESLHLQRLTLGGPLESTPAIGRKPRMQGESGRRYRLRALLRPLCYTLTSLNLDLRLLSEKAFDMYGKPKRITTLRYMRALRHLTITSDAIVGWRPRPHTIQELRLDRFFPPMLETLTIRESAYIHPNIYESTPKYIDHTRAQTMFLLLEKIAKVFIGKQGSGEYNGRLKKAVLSAQYSTELGELAQWSTREKNRRKLWDVMAEYAEFSLEIIKRKLSLAGIRFVVEMEPSLDLEVDFRFMVIEYGQAEMMGFFVCHFRCWTWRFGLIMGKLV